MKGAKMEAKRAERDTFPLVVYALSLPPRDFSPSHPLRSSLSSGFIFVDQGVFCQVSPIKFALHEHFRTSRYLEIPSTNETGAPIRISRSPPMRDFRSFFPRFRNLFFFLLLPRCFRQKSSSFMHLATRSERVESLRYSYSLAETLIPCTKSTVDYLG